MRDMFKTRSHSWEEVGLSRQISEQSARRARRQAAVLLPALAGILVVYSYRQEIFGADFDFVVRIITVIALVILGWAFARDVGRAVGPAMFRRMDPATAGTVGFLLRLLTIGIALIVALHVAGLDPTTLALGGAVTAVVLGLAAQQTLGNVFAGTVLLSARPFRVGDRVRLKGGPVAGQVEGVVSSLGLLYLTLASGDDSIMVPNSVVLSMAVIPLREPDGVDLRARLPAEVLPSDVQALLEEAVTVPTRTDPRIVLEELDGDEIVVRIEATPRVAAEGPKLANEILAAVGGMVRDGANGANGANNAPGGNGAPGDSPLA
jgi:small-conductance mechanosensitive channel